MVIFTQNIWHICCCSRIQGINTWVHIASHIGSIVSIRRFWMNRSCTVVVLEVPDQIIEHAICIRSTAAVIIFVSGWPHNDGSAVFQSVECGNRTIHCQVLEVYLFFSLIHQCMRFQVGLTHHVNTVFITQIIQILVVAVVRGTQCI